MTEQTNQLKDSREMRLAWYEGQRMLKERVREVKREPQGGKKKQQKKTGQFEKSVTS